MSKTALITGVRGQDGAYLSEFLLSKGYRVVGTDRRRVDLDNWRLEYLGIDKDVEFIYMDLLDIGNIFRTIEKVQPDEIYNLAAQSFVGVSFNQPMLTTDVNAIGVLRLLDALRIFKADSKFYQASTSEMFGKVKESPQNEDTPFNPRSPYGIAKLYGHFITKNYRDSFDMYTSSGILFNHESPLRGIEFVTRKITNAVVRIKAGMQDYLTLGNMDAKRDWGYAKDYVHGMWLMLQQKVADDYVLATGETHSVREFVEKTFRLAGFDIYWKGKGVEEQGIDKNTGIVLIKISPKFYRPSEVDYLLGDAKKAKNELGWKAEVDFDGLIEIMLEAEYDFLK